MDTTFSVVSGKSILVMTNLGENGFGKIPSWIYAVINDTSIVLKSGVKIGMSKNAFTKIVAGRPIDCDSIRVMDEEQMSNNYFLFRNNKLYKIVLHSGSE